MDEQSQQESGSENRATFGPDKSQVLGLRAPSVTDPELMSVTDSDRKQDPNPFSQKQAFNPDTFTLMETR